MARKAAATSSTGSVERKARCESHRQSVAPKPATAVAADGPGKGALEPFARGGRHDCREPEPRVEEEPVDVPVRAPVAVAPETAVPLDPGEAAGAEGRADVEVVPGPERDRAETPDLENGRRVLEDQAVDARLHLRAVGSARPRP